MKIDLRSRLAKKPREQNIIKQLISELNDLVTAVSSVVSICDEISPGTVDDDTILLLTVINISLESMPSFDPARQPGVGSIIPDYQWQDYRELLKKLEIARSMLILMVSVYNPHIAPFMYGSYENAEGSLLILSRSMPRYLFSSVTNDQQQAPLQSLDTQKYLDTLPPGLSMVVESEIGAALREIDDDRSSGYMDILEG